MVLDAHVVDRYTVARKSTEMHHPEPLTPPHSSKSSVHMSDAADCPDSLDLIGTTKFPALDGVKNILVTGGAGFIGGWMTRHLTLKYPEYAIICFDKLNEVASLANVRCLDPYPNFRFVQGDLTDQAALEQVLAEHDVHCVIHFAAESHVQKSFDDPSRFTLNNVVATQKLLDAVRARGAQIRRFIHISTDEVYGDTFGDFVNEEQQFMPTNPYSASKAAAEMYVWGYAKSFNIPALVVRSNNVYGPGQYPEKIIPRFFLLLSQQKPLTIQGSGLNVRRYLYGADAVDGFDTALHKGQVGEAYNLMSSFGVTNLEVAVRMLELWGYNPELDFSQHLAWIVDRPFNDHDYRVDGSKIESLGWRQKVSFFQGLRITVAWYHRNIASWWSGLSEPESDDL